MGAVWVAVDDGRCGGAGRFLTRLFTIGTCLTILCIIGAEAAGAWCGSAGSGASGWSLGTRMSGKEATGTVSAGNGENEGAAVNRRTVAATGPKYPTARTASIAVEMYLPARKRSSAIPCARAA
jgi:hypothetical protein